MRFLGKDAGDLIAQRRSDVDRYKSNCEAIDGRFQVSMRFDLICASLRLRTFSTESIGCGHPCSGNYYNLRRYRRYNARRRRVRSFCQDVCYYSLSTRKPRSSREAVGRLRYKRCQIDHTRHQHNTDMSHGGCATADAVSRTDEDGRIHMRTTLFAVVAPLAILA